MLSRVSTSFSMLFTFAVLATATPWGQPTPATTTVTVTVPGPTAPAAAGQCNTGPVQCCNSVQQGNSIGASMVLGLLGIILDDPTTLVGLTCSPLTVVGVGESSCTTQTVCCENNDFNGLIAIGCSPVDL